MSDDHIIGWLIFFSGIGLGYLVGHGRGYISGVRWCTKRLLVDNPVTPANRVEP